MRWTIRLPHGKPLGIITASNIDAALTLARAKTRIHDVTVDNLEPLGSQPKRAVVRYLNERRSTPGGVSALGKILGRWWDPDGR